MLFFDGVLMMKSPDEPGVYVPAADRPEELMGYLPEPERTMSIQDQKNERARTLGAFT